MTKEQIAKLTNVLIFKDGYYYITEQDPLGGYYTFEMEGLHNGFEFASDAYAYLVHLQTKKEKVKDDESSI